MNVAQRLQAEAVAEEILISVVYLRLCVTGHRPSPAGTRALKGRSGLVEVYRIPWTARDG